MLKTERLVSAKYGRFAKEKVFNINSVWQRRYYEHKKEDMKVTYDPQADLLYTCLDPSKRELRNREVSEDLIEDLEAEDRIVGIEVLDTSRRRNLESFLHIEFEQAV